MKRVVLVAVIAAMASGCAGGERSVSDKTEPRVTTQPAPAPEPELDRIDVGDDRERDPRSAKPGSASSSEEDTLVIDVTDGD